MPKTLRRILNRKIKFGFSHTFFLWWILGGFWDEKREHNLPTIWKFPKRILTNPFVANLNSTLNDPNKFAEYHTHLRDLWQFRGVSLGRNTIKTKHDFKNIPKNDEKNLTNNFFKNIHMYFKLQKYIWFMPHFFQRPVMNFGWFLGFKNWTEWT